MWYQPRPSNMAQTFSLFIQNSNTHPENPEIEITNRPQSNEQNFNIGMQNPIKNNSEENNTIGINI